MLWPADGALVRIIESKEHRMESTAISKYTPQYNTGSGLPENLKTVMTENTKAVTVNTEKRMDLKLVTAEGDKVTISLDAKMAALYGSHEKSAMDGTGYAHQSTSLAYGSYEREITFAVEGDLNADERRDIKLALKSLDRMMHHFVNGNLKPMLAKADQIKGLDTIAGFEASMSFQRQVIRAEQSEVTMVSQTPPATQAASAPASEPSQPELDKLAESADAVGDAMAEKIKANRDRIDRMVAFFEKLVDDYRQQVQGLNKIGTRMIDRIAQRVNDALARHTSETGSAGPADEA
ncbi:hypothetical protein [Desulfatitalea alkaliphila]|uniref:Uncharacterized protein n=1 Tax=Desulfatitalea alkaliphila TaxID=2929485 RepID=A0AA41R646_9BACT|nr:hypothetical protein [Desulfatitalea alkaliphila]MCJ8499853.1 hypothetical protein [Desulfatitalea alkaliphila]